MPSWEGAAEAIELGVFRYLPKPFDIEHLRGTVMQATQLWMAAERDILTDMGCDLFQGFLFARPEAAFHQPVF